MRSSSLPRQWISIHVFSTIGFGNVAPRQTCTSAQLVLLLETFWSLLVVAAISGYVVKQFLRVHDSPARSKRIRSCVHALTMAPERSWHCTRAHGTGRDVVGTSMQPASRAPPLTCALAWSSRLHRACAAAALGYPFLELHLAQPRPSAHLGGGGGDGGRAPLHCPQIVCCLNAPLPLRPVPWCISDTYEKPPSLTRDCRECACLGAHGACQ